MLKLLKLWIIASLVLAPLQPVAWAKPRRPVPIVKPDLPIVDSEAYWSQMERDSSASQKGGAGQSNGGKNQSPKSAESGAGAGSGNGTEFTKPGSTKVTEGGSPGTPAQSGSSSSGGGSLQIHNLWWPICMFMDEGIDQAKGNEIIKGVIADANACGVNVVVWPRTVKSSSWPPPEGAEAYRPVNDLTREKCNLPDELAAAGSSTALVPPTRAYDNMAAKMCEDPKELPPPATPEEKWNFDVAGCAELRDTGQKPKKTAQEMKQGSGAHSHNVSKFKVAVSIEVTKGHTADVVSHEAIGHSQMGKPNGSRYGKGIGEEEDFGKDGPGEGAVTTEWSASGCATMRANALPNTRRFGFDPGRQTYYVKPRDPSAFYDIKNDPPIFGTSKSLSLAAGKGPPQVIPQGQTIVANEENKKGTTTPTDLTKSSALQATVASESDEGGRHPKPKRGSDKLLAASDRGLAEAPEKPEDAAVAIERPPSEVPPERTGKLGVNEGNAKARPPSQSASLSSSDAIDTYSGASAGPGGAGTSDTTGINESAPQGAAYGQPASSAGTRGGLAASDTIGVNETAEKGANYRGREQSAEIASSSTYSESAPAGEEPTLGEAEPLKKRLPKQPRVPASETARRKPRGVVAPYAEP